LEHNRKRVAKRLASGLMAGALALGGLAISGSSPAGAVPFELDPDQRLGGDDRYATSAIVAEALEDEGVSIDTVIVASGQNFPDALAASALAGDQPILLVTQTSIPSSVRDRMNRLADDVNDVIVVGGTAAVSESVFGQLEDIFDAANVVRLAGDDRYSTAVAIAEEVGLDAGTIALVSGQSYADAVSIGGWAAAQGYPILLATSDGIPDATSEALEAALDEDAATRVVVVGGTSVVAAGVEDDLVELGFASANVSRIAGPDRYYTNLFFNIENLVAGTTSKYLNASDALTLLGQNVVFVTGENFADALTAAPLASHLGAHVILTTATGGVAALSYAQYGAAGTGDDDAGVTAMRYSASFIDIAGAIRWAQDVWAVGGTTAVTAGAMAAVDAAAASSVDCEISVEGASSSSDLTDVKGPDRFVISFSDDLSAGVAGFDALGEASIVDAHDTLEDYIEIDGTGANATGATLLDLDGSGAPDAVSVVVAAEVDEGDNIEFLGWPEEEFDYATTGAGLREFTACDVDVDGDTTAPTMTIDAAEGSDGIIVTFSEPLKGGVDFTVNLEAALDTAATETDNECTANTANQVFYCLDAGNDWTSSMDLPVADTTAGTTSADVDFYDDAGNVLSAGADDDVDDFATATADLVAPEIDDVTYECAHPNAVSYKITNNWVTLVGNTAGDGAANNASADGRIDIPFASGDVQLTAESSLAGWSPNEWTVTIENSRGLNIPTVEVDGTDVTVTIDRFFHTASDVVAAIDRSAAGTGWITFNWNAALGTASATDTIDVDSVGVSYDTVDGVVHENSCLVTIEFDSAAAGGTELDEKDGATATAGTVAFKIDGSYLDADNFDCSYELNGATGAGATDEAGYVAYCLLYDIADDLDSTGFTVEAFVGYMGDTGVDALTEFDV